MDVSQFLGHGFVFTQPDTSVREVARLMGRYEVDVVLVRDRESLVGIVTERDLVLRAVAAGFSPAEEPISDVMTPDPVTIGGGASIEAALERMTARGISRLCVVDGDEVLGIVAARDLVTASPVAARSIGERSSLQN